MSEESAPGIKTFFDYLHIFLRYIASGFVAGGVYFYLYNPAAPNLKEEGLFFIFVTATIGFVTYALHFSTLDKVFYAVGVMRFFKKHQLKSLPAILETQIVKWEHEKGNSKFAKANIFEDETGGDDLRLKLNDPVKRRLLFALASQTYLRKISAKPRIKELQAQVESRLAMLNFLYCSFYQVSIILLAFALINFRFSAEFDGPLACKFLLLLVFDTTLFFSALRFNYRICCREMWLVHNFPQEVDDIDVGQNASKATERRN